jgi:hypothetical protein
MLLLNLKIGLLRRRMLAAAKDILAYGYSLRSGSIAAVAEGLDYG